jgi:hypothetical protein
MAWEDLDDMVDDTTDEAQAEMFEEALAREARHDARAEEDPDGAA